MTSISVRTPDYYNLWFSARTEIFDFANKNKQKKHTASRGASRRKLQLHSTFHQGVKIPHHGFQPENENVDFSKKLYHAKAHLKGGRMEQVSAMGSRMAQNSTSEHIPARSERITRSDVNFGQNP